MEGSITEILFYSSLKTTGDNFPFRTLLLTRKIRIIK